MRLVRISHQEHVFCEALAQVLDSTFGTGRVPWEPSNNNVLLTLAIIVVTMNIAAEWISIHGVSRVDKVNEWIVCSDWG